LLKSSEKKSTRRVRRNPRHPGYRAADQRRAAIIDALRRSMLDKGFSGTSLTHLAKLAGMSVSHFLYYFPDKETVLAELAKSFTDQTLDYIGGLAPKPAAVQTRELVDYIFGGRSVPLAYRSLILQLMAVATHDRKLLARQRQQAQGFQAFLRQLFRKSPGGPLKPEDAAALAGAIWMGLYVDSYFDPALTMPRAARLMQSAIAWLGGFDQADLTSNNHRGKKARGKVRKLKKPVPARMLAVHDGKERNQPQGRRLGSPGQRRGSRLVGK
jgi:AcrR family transcriptional regulator